MRDGSDPCIEIGLSVFLAAVSVAVLVEAAGLPAGIYEPLGSAAIPQAVAVLILLLSLWMGGRAFGYLSDRRGGAPATPGDAPTHVLRIWSTIAVLGLAILYVLAMQLEWMGFAIATSVFLFLSIGILARFTRRSVLLAVGLALLVGFGGEWLFTNVLIIDLPT